MIESKMPPLTFVTGVAHAAGLGPNVVVSFSGYEHGDGNNGAFPITHRIVINRESLAQSIDFLKKYLEQPGTSAVEPIGPIQ